MPIQDRMHGADRRTQHLGVLAAQVDALQSLGGDLIYALPRNQILSLTTGRPVWQSASATSVQAR
jgi:hypothetical protein